MGNDNAEEKEREDARDFMKGELIEIWGLTKEEPARKGGKINIEIPARLTGLLQRELQPEHNSTLFCFGLSTLSLCFSLYQRFWKT